MPYVDQYLNDARIYQDRNFPDRTYNPDLPYGSGTAAGLSPDQSINFGVSHRINPRLVNPNNPAPSIPGHMLPPYMEQGNFDQLMNMGREFGGAMLGAIPGINAINALRGMYNYQRPQSYEVSWPVDDGGSAWQRFFNPGGAPTPSMYQQGTIPQQRTVYGDGIPMGIYPPIPVPRDVEKL